MQLVVNYLTQRVMRTRLQQLSVLLILSITIISCGTTNKTHPSVSVCVVSNGSGGLVCSDKEGKTAFIKFIDAENFGCFSPSDLEELISH